jgi:hypothetical protein
VDSQGSQDLIKKLKKENEPDKTKNKSISIYDKTILKQKEYEIGGKWVSPFPLIVGN